MKKLLLLASLLFLSSQINAQETVKKKECVETTVTYKKVILLVSEKDKMGVWSMTGYVVENVNNYISFSYTLNSYQAPSYPDNSDYRDIDFKKLPENYIVWQCVNSK